MVGDGPVLAGLVALALAVVEVVPRLFPRPPAWAQYGPVPPPSAPPAAALLTVGLGVSLCSAAAVYVALSRKAGFPRLALWLAVAYNVPIVLVKFSLGPAALWQPSYESFLGTAGVAAGKALGIFLIYAAAFAIVGVFFWERTRRRILRGKPGPSFLDRHGPRVLVLTGILVFGGSLLFIGWSLAPALSGDPYLQVLFDGTLGVGVAVLLAGALTSGILAFAVTGNRAVTLRDASLVATLFWTGLALLAIYHALWVFYVLSLSAIWPLRTYVPK